MEEVFIPLAPAALERFRAILDSAPEINERFRDAVRKARPIEIAPEED